MEKVAIKVESNPSMEDRNYLFRRLDDADALVVRPMDSRFFGVYLRDDEGKIWGGGHGTTVWNWLYVAQVWVSDGLRGKGFGKEIVSCIEGQGMQMGCDSAYLNTFDFQAVNFYQKLGYEIFGQLGDFPEKHQCYFMKKKLNN